MKRKLSREMTIIFATWPIQNRFPSSGFGQSRPGRPAAGQDCVDVQSHRAGGSLPDRSDESQARTRFDADVFASRGLRRGRVAMLQSARDQVNQNPVRTSVG
jgi:hypothetical protein